MGREGWFEETISFYDQYLKGTEPTVDYPNFAIQDSTGTWRAQDTWPVVERSATIPLGGGSYVDDGAEGGPTAENTFTAWSQPLEQDIRLTGTPRISLNAVGRGNTMIQLYDVAPTAPPSCSTSTPPCWARVPRPSTSSRPTGR
ncbi:hypothetical protein AB0L88_26060 [Saccharopolyspora shandongensis]|uniref:hypothetical protein n=1 Tax=Saccharopolyspora shandongensis TaxID=418495 RepID=UPI0034279842